MRCPIGWPTKRSGWPRSAPPRLNWRRKPKAAAEEETRRRAQAEESRIAEGRKKNGKTPAPPKQEPEGKAQRNFIDPDSRILKTKDGYIQGYNAQAAVDAEAQIIVAHSLTPSTSDQDQFVPLLDTIEDDLDRRSSASMKGSASKALSPSTAPGSTDSSSGSAQVRSCACPGVSITSTGLPSASTRAWILVVSPPRERPIACSPFFFVRRRCAGERARWWRRSSCIRYHGRSPAA